MTATTISMTSIMTFMIAVIPAVYRLLQPIVQAKILAEKDLRVKYRLEILDYLAEIAVAEMANSKDLSNVDRKAAASKFVADRSVSLGSKITKTTINAAVEAAYQAYKHRLGGDIHRSDPNS